jgi:hypothetical protein
MSESSSHNSENAWQRAFDDAEITPSDHLWEGIEAKLHAPTLAWWQKPAVRLSGMAALLLLLLGWGYLNYFSENQIVNTNSLSSEHTPSYESAKITVPQKTAEKAQTANEQAHKTTRPPAADAAETSAISSTRTNPAVVANSARPAEKKLSQSEKPSAVAANSPRFLPKINTQNTSPADIPPVATAQSRSAAEAPTLRPSEAPPANEDTRSATHEVAAAPPISPILPQNSISEGRFSPNTNKVVTPDAGALPPTSAVAPGATTTAAIPYSWLTARSKVHLTAVDLRPSEPNYAGSLELPLYKRPKIKNNYWIGFSAHVLWYDTRLTENPSNFLFSSVSFSPPGSTGAGTQTVNQRQAFVQSVDKFGSGPSVSIPSYQLNLVVGGTLSKGFFWESGLQYTQARAYYESNILMLNNAKGASFSPASSALYESLKGTDIGNATLWVGNSNIQIQSDYQFLAIPLKIGYQTSLAPRIKLALAAGLSGEFLLSHQLSENDNGVQSTYEAALDANATRVYKRFTPSVLINPSLRISVSPRTTWVIEGQYQSALSGMLSNGGLFQLQPRQLGLGTGIRYQLGAR